MHYGEECEKARGEEEHLVTGEAVSIRFTQAAGDAGLARWSEGTAAEAGGSSGFPQVKAEVHPHKGWERNITNGCWLLQLVFIGFISRNCIRPHLKVQQWYFEPL